jgi:uncharacterized surface protein with fasciclin (FAS1) repeats
MNMNPINGDLISKLSLYTLFCVFWSFGMASEPTSKTLIDFSDESVANQWISVNDNVMGGISDGQFRITDENTLEFFGSLSLENNGGFASIRTKGRDFNLNGYDAIGLRLKGDGRTYFFNLMTSPRSSASSYRAPVETKKDTWQNVQISLKDFVYTSFGRIIGGVGPLKAKDIQSLGFTLSDKKSGPFQLEVSEIRAEKATDTNETSVARQSNDSDKSMDIVDTAISAGTFKTLVAAVKAAGLLDSLKGEGPLTVFAPSDEAFAKLPEGAVEDLLKPENREKLIAVLSYHVVPGKILLSDQLWQTLQGQSIKIKTPGSFQVNEAKVLKSDIVTSNGVIHVIDNVLLPPVKKLSPRQAAKEVIQLAINRGVPLFNAGQSSACAAIYEVAANSLLKSHTNALDEEGRSILQDALNKVQNDDDASQKAWTLRGALDSVNQSLDED